MNITGAQLEGIRSFIGGGCGSVMSQCVIVPVDVVASRLQLQGSVGYKYQYKGGFDAFRQVWRHEGLRGFYRGWGASVLTYAPFSAVWWSTYAVTKGFLYRKTGVIESSSGMQRGPDFLLQSMSGVVAAFSGVMFTNPMDVVKTRMQTKTGSSAAAEGGILKNLTTLVKEEGWMAMTKGASVRYVLLFSLYFFFLLCVRSFNPIYFGCYCFFIFLFPSLPFSFLTSPVPQHHQQSPFFDFRCNGLRAHQETVCANGSGCGSTCDGPRDVKTFCKTKVTKSRLPPLLLVFPPFLLCFLF